MASSSSTARIGASPAASADAVAGAEADGADVPVPLAELAIGDRAIVHRLRIERNVARRLMELGLLPGTPIEVVRVAPLGDPLEVALRGYRLSIRRSEAASVDVVGRRPGSR
jgi:ferrous iron transport protein A